jgi:ElaA protein
MSERPTLRAVAFDDLTPRQLYAILKLRAEVFVVEQDCVYTDMDGRDGEPGAIQLWHESADGAVLSTARLLRESVDGIETGRIGRIATLRSARSQGLAAALIRHGLEHFADQPVVLGAQMQLEDYYGRFGFTRSGDPYDEDGIPHIPMRREAA